MIARLHLRQEGVFITEVVMVIAILLTLTGIVLMAIVGIRERAEDTRLEDERVTISLAAASFYTASRFSSFPVLDANEAEPRLRPIDFEAPLPQDPAKSFVPHFLKNAPVSAHLVTWLIDVKTGAVSYARDDT